MTVREYVGLCALLFFAVVLTPLVVYTCAKLWAYGRLKGERLFRKHYPETEECHNGHEQTRKREERGS